jgi:hypothetical protein
VENHPKENSKMIKLYRGEAKKLKLNKTFSQNLNFWKCKEIGPHEVTTVLETQTKTSNNISHTQITSLEVVRWRDSPGGIDGRFADGDRPGELCQP